MPKYLYYSKNLGKNCTLNLLPSNNFEGNQADHAGGALHWEHIQPNYSNQSFSMNNNKVNNS